MNIYHWFKVATEASDYAWAVSAILADVFCRRTGSLRSASVPASVRRIDLLT
jgi:hypothetical protein